MIHTPKTQDYFFKLIKQIGINAYKGFIETLSEDDQFDAKEALGAYKKSITPGTKALPKQTKVNEWFISTNNSASGRLKIAEFLCEKLDMRIDLFFASLNRPSLFNQDQKNILNKQAGKELNYDF